MGDKGPGTSDGDLPRLHDEPPPPWVGVPVERDPATGRLLRGRPGGRGDKGRSAARARLPALIAAAVVLVVGGTTLAVALTRGSDGTGAAQRSGAGDPGGSTGNDPGETDGSGEPSEPVDEAPAEADRRPVPMEFTVTAIRTPPGQEGGYGSVGDTSDALWLLTGPCDGDGPCAVEHCINEAACTFEFTLTPAGSGYTGQFEFSWFDNPWPECGAVRVAVALTVSEGATGPAYSGTFTQSHGAPLGYDGNVSHCNIALTDASFRSV